MPKKNVRALPEADGEGSAADVAPTTRVTRQTRSNAEAGKRTPRESRYDKPKGSYQPSTLPRRNAPLRARSQSVESVPTEDFPQSSYDLAERFSSTKRQEPSSTHELDQSDEAEEALDEEDSFQEIIDFTLPDLATWAGRIYNDVVKAESAPADQLSWNRLALIERKFNELRQKITSVKTFFINPKDLNELFSGIHDTGHLDFVSRTLASANTALLLKLILKITHGKQKVQPVLEELNAFFPGGFRICPDEELSAYALSDYEITYPIRCLVLADRIREYGQLSPTVLAAELFCAGETPKQVKIAKEMLLNGPYELGGTDDDLEAGGETAEKLAEVHSHNMKDLYATLSHKSRLDIIRSLEEAHPIQDILKDLSDWAHEAYKTEQKNAVDEKARTPVPMASPAQTEPRLGQDPPASSVPPPNAASRSAARSGSVDQAKTGRGDASESLFVDSNQLEPAADPEAESESESEQEQDEPIVRTGPLAGSYIDRSAALEPNGSTAGGRPRPTPPSNQQAIGNPFAGLNPEEVVDDQRRRSASRHRSSQAGPSRAQMIGHKRPAADDDEDYVDTGSNAEDDFQVDKRPINDSRRTTNKGQNRGQAAKRDRVSQAQSASISGERQSVSLSARPRPSPDDLQPDDIAILTQRARAATRKHREPKAPQRREKWGDKDTVTLINAIPRFECAWSLMEEKNLFTVPRTQQQIRDKARNVKVDFLKSDYPLPAGFDFVALGKKEIDAVKLLGKNPMRSEGDRDDNGNVINNVWDPELEFEEHRRRQSDEQD
ncbi:hypothetical protein SCAR479_06044 [Seiridium cardinale]|uniref:Myb-like domain-containing protein n=1 Tax=Seiridium cardinale TaxID=138064 RepID=A0ABR2XU28_9PEZI